MKCGKITDMDDKWHIGKGWVPLLEIVDNVMGEDIKWDYKEKYGTLRIELYDGDWTEQQLNVVDRIEQISCFICENCGSQGTIKTEGWFKTLCDDCDKKWRD